jgi:Flp pilus assembly protein TadG
MLNRSDAKQNASPTGFSYPVRSVFRRSAGEEAADPRSSRRRRRRISQGQSMVEFALISAFALAVMLVGIQYALIGQAAVAVSQGASALARYASANPGTLGNSTGNGSVTLNQGLENLLSSTIGTNSWGDLTVTITSYQGTTSNVTTAASNPNGPQFGDRCVISFSYNTRSKLAVPNPFLAVPPIFPGISFPSQLGASAAQLYE